jgi:hypothetical protein
VGFFLTTFFVLVGAFLAGDFLADDFFSFLEGVLALDFLGVVDFLLFFFLGPYDSYD